MVATKPAPRRRNAEATRAAILESARRAFVARGYDGAGVRQIAEGAGVTAMLVNRYFGSKENLFAEVVAGSLATPTVLTEETVNAPDAGARIAAGMIAVTEAGAIARHLHFVPDDVADFLARLDTVADDAAAARIAPFRADPAAGSGHALCPPRGAPAGAGRGA